MSKPGNLNLKALRKAEDACLCFALRKASRSVTRLYDEALRDAGISINQFSLLLTIACKAPVSVNTLAASAAMDQSTLSRNLRPLEKKGLIQLRPGADRRQRLVRLSARGRRVIARAYPLWKEAQVRAEAVLGGRRFGRLLADLQATIT